MVVGGGGTVSSESLGQRVLIKRSAESGLDTKKI